MTENNGPEGHAPGCPGEFLDDMAEIVKRARKVTLGQLIDFFSGVFSRDRDDYLAAADPPKRKRRG